MVCIIYPWQPSLESKRNLYTQGIYNRYLKGIFQKPKINWNILKSSDSPNIPELHHAGVVMEYNHNTQTNLDLILTIELNLTEEHLIVSLQSNISVRPTRIQ